MTQFMPCVGGCPTDVGGSTNLRNSNKAEGHPLAKEPFATVALRVLRLIIVRELVINVWISS